MKSKSLSKYWHALHESKDPWNAMTSFGTSDYQKQYWKFQEDVGLAISNFLKKYPALIEVFETDLDNEGRTILDRFDAGEVSLAALFNYLEEAIDAAESSNTYSRPDRTSDS